MPNLEVLLLNNLGLDAMPPWVASLTSLRVLSLNFNRLRALPAVLVGKLTHLEELYAFENLLESVDAGIVLLLPKLRVLDVNRNPTLHSPPPSVARRGSRSVLEHLWAIACTT